MAKAATSGANIRHVVKRTKQGGRIKTSSLNKSAKRSFKAYRGQGK